jgi:phospholipid/cholesterol/gamma-HCH transport system substrate-binding protein
MTHRRHRAIATAALILVALTVLSGCGFRNINSLPLPGTAAQGSNSLTIDAQLPDVTTLEPNSTVRVGDVVVGTVTAIRLQGWHALVSMRLISDVDLPANATAKLAQTSLLGSTHIELAPPRDVPPEGKLRDGSVIPLSSAATYPTTEQTLAAVSLVLNGGGIGQLQDITTALSTAFSGRGNDVKQLIQRLDEFTRDVNDQTGDIIDAIDSLNGLVGQFASQKTVLDKALRAIPDALAVLKQQRGRLTEVADKLGRLAGATTDVVNKTKDNLVAELQQLGPVLDSLANTGPGLTRSLSAIATYPWPNETLQNWVRGDYANFSIAVDLTLSRLDRLFTGTRWEGQLTELEMQWGRTIGQTPSPYTGGNPLVAPYHWDQGP